MLQYWIKTGRRLNLQNPRRFTEKMQWYKLYYRDPLMSKCVDKYNVRDYIRSKGLECILNELYITYDNGEQIQFEELPEKFVMKTTNGGGGNNIILCKDKRKGVDIQKVKKQLDKWLNSKQYNSGREWVYSGVKPRIVIEKFLDSGAHGGLTDYKFYCFNGKPYCVFVMNDRFSEEGTKKSIYDINFNLLPYGYSDSEKLSGEFKKPKKFDEMIKIASKLSEDFPFVRVDLYNIDGTIIFGELTFFPGSGYLDFKPDEFDFKLGKQFILPKKMP